jgi:hypothetical protein
VIAQIVAAALADVYTGMPGWEAFTVDALRYAPLGTGVLLYCSLIAGVPSFVVSSPSRCCSTAGAIRSRSSH